MTNTEIVKSMYEAFGRGDIGAILNSVSDNIDWTVPGPSAIPYAGHYRGRQEVAGFFQKLADTTEFDPFQIEQYLELADQRVSGLPIRRVQGVQSFTLF